MTVDFIFCCGSDEVTLNRIRGATRFHWGGVKEINVHEFWLFISSNHYGIGFVESSDSLGAIAGYVRDDMPEGAGLLGTAHNRRFISHITKDDSWPLGEQWTGSFSAVAYSKQERAIVICNDPIGPIPLYYRVVNSTIIGGTSLIVLSHCIDCEADITGIIERITALYCNYGRRTLLKRISRLLPGEWLKVSSNNSSVKSIFDNSLCSGLLDGDINRIARKVWDCLQREITLATEGLQHTCVAMSGGWDSRLILAGLADKGESVECYTYGNGDIHESQLALRCAKAIGANHRSFPIEDKYFPPKPDLEFLVKKTEAANYMQWFTIIDSFKVRGPSNEPILLGEECESIDGRNILTLSSREARKRSFLNQLMGNETRFAVATTASFDQWRERKQTQLIEDMLRKVGHLAPGLANGLDEKLLIQELLHDLELSFSRVRDNLPAFVPMLDELFAWFHRCRYLAASQNLLLSSMFRPISPAMSLRFLRLISTVHPRLRLRRRLIDAIARLPEFDALAEIPSAQIPWLSARSPALLKELVWGIRSGMDQLMLRRILRSKNPNRRHSVLPKLDIIKEYRRDNVEDNVRSWFSGRWVKPDRYIERVRNRRNLITWPLINLDITATANVSITLDLCQIDGCKPLVQPS